MSRDVPYDKEVICDNCGKRGGYDFMGDCYCPDCLTSDKEGNTIVKNNPGDWKCPKCGNVNEHQAVKCEFCNHGAVVDLFQGGTRIDIPCKSCIYNPKVVSKINQLEATCQQWKSEAERCLKLAEEYKGQRDRARGLAGELVDFAEDNYPMIMSCKRGIELKQRLKDEEVIK